MTRRMTREQTDRVSTTRAWRRPMLTVLLILSAVLGGAALGHALARAFRRARVTIDTAPVVDRTWRTPVAPRTSPEDQ